MRIALRELRREPGRFGVATVTLSLIAMLLIFLAALLDGLISSITGSYYAQPGQLVVFADDANAVLGASVVSEAERADAAAVLPDDAQLGGISSIVVGARTATDDSPVGVTLAGVELAPQGVPLADLGPGDVWADADLAFSVGDTLELGPARVPVTVVGVSEPGDSPSEGALWGTMDTFGEVLVASRPGAVMAEGASQGVVVKLAGEPTATELDAAAQAIDEATGTTQTLTIAEAANAIPGVSAQKTTFGQIQGVTLAVALLVVALFFALLTVERTGLYGVLKAMGSRSSRIFAGVAVQALVVTLIASLIGGGLVLAAGLAMPEGAVPFKLNALQFVQSIGALALASVIGSAFSLRRVLNIDPAAAIGGDS